ncbi:Primase-like protein [Acholeplasma hippikon]|uniref:Primase-like protein n=1 Tax=Acholeplasma hippikon TaxID=264636 RepID=A0A449BKR9_9MOLU|nr:Primase-like protein [Acholeplasma hippikon]
MIHNQDKFEIVLLLDPDFPGEKIRKTLASKLSNPKHIFFDRKASISKNRKKVGIEHVDFKLIREMIQYEVKEQEIKTDLNIHTLYELGLTGQINSFNLRKVITDYYHIGHCNTKILLQRLTWLGLTKEDLVRVLNGASS